MRLLLHRRPIAAIALGILVLLSGAAIAAPWLGLPPPDRIDVAHRLLPPTAAHPFGTHNFGRAGGPADRVLPGGGPPRHANS